MLKTVAKFKTHPQWYWKILIGQFLHGDKKADGNAGKAEPEAK